MAVQAQMPERVRLRLTKDMIGELVDRFRVTGVLGGGTTAVTYQVEDQNFHRWALKVVTRDSYGERAPLRDVARFAQAEDTRFLVFPEEIGDWTLKLPEGDICRFVWFKSRLVHGQTLTDFLNSGVEFSASVEITRYMENLSVGLEELRRLGFSHGDLHGRNIMREVIGEGSLLPEIRYVIIDFTEAHPVDDVEGGLSKDIESFGGHLKTFYLKIRQREEITREDQTVLGAIEHIPGQVNGMSAESMGISRASDVLMRFEDALRNFEETPRKLVDPFSPLSAESIANDALFAELCFDSVWWAEELRKNSNVLLIGPRGCGKTTLFRRLRLKTKLMAKKTTELLSDPYVAFYLPCESLFYMRFSDLAQVDIQRNKHAFTLFFNMAVLTEVASTLAVAPSQFGLVPASLTSVLARLVKEELGSLWESLGFSDGVTSLEELATCAEKVMRHISKKIAYGEVVSGQGSTEFVTRLVDVIKRGIPSLAGRHVIFLLDDYTEGRVPLALQQVLHPIVCQRSPDICFKISAHMYGSIYNLPRPLALDEGRNIQIINLGQVYVTRQKTQEEDILRHILDNRFGCNEAHGGTIEDWLGKTSYPGGKTLSRALHDEARRRGPRVYYHGVECLMDLCTGDYSEMIRLVGEIFREGRIAPKSAIRLIPPAAQDEAIRRVSREYLSRIRHIRPEGQKLYKIVDCFGALSRQLLVKHRLVGQGKDKQGRPRRDPYDQITIYVDDLTRASDQARMVWELLQKASVLVDIGVSPSQRKVIADRATLRRLYCPAFRTTLTSSEKLQLTKNQFEYFMDQPKEFCGRYLQSSVGANAQLALFGEGEVAETEEEDEIVSPSGLPYAKDQKEFGSKAPAEWKSRVALLPQLSPLVKAISRDSRFRLYIGAMGFEERTTGAVDALVEMGVRVDNGILLEFDIYYDATEKRRSGYEKSLGVLLGGKQYRPFLAPVSTSEVGFPNRMMNLMKTLAGSDSDEILFDCTSCPSLVLAQVLKVLLRHRCNLTVLYSEAREYFPTRSEWESSEVKSARGGALAPFEGFRFTAKPPSLQSDDIGEKPVLLVLFPTFTRERTESVLAEIDPATRVWIFGQPHDPMKNAYRIEMAQWFAAPVMYPGDPWSLVSTFDYKGAMVELAGIYETYHKDYRMVVLPHGSKMQTLGTGLFASPHEVSMVFAMPMTYDPDRYSRGCIEAWALPLGDTQDLVNQLRANRVLGSGGAFRKT